MKTPPVVDEGSEMDMASGAERTGEGPDGPFAGDASRKSEWREPPRSADRRHAVELEAFAGNQRPKTRDHREPRLYQYEGTDLYQWYSKTDSEFHDPVGEPFVIPPVPSDRGAHAMGEARHADGWRPWSKIAKPLRRIVAMYDDGSGARVYFHAEDGQLFCGEDGCEYAWADLDNLSVWSYLPPGYRLWVECTDEPMTFPDPPDALTPQPDPVIHGLEDGSARDFASTSEPLTVPDAAVNADTLEGGAS